DGARWASLGGMRGNARRMPIRSRRAGGSVGRMGGVAGEIGAAPPSLLGHGSEGDVVVGFAAVLVVLGIEAVPGGRVEGELIVEAEQVLAGVEVHVEQPGGVLAIGAEVDGGREKGGVGEAESCDEGFDAGGERGEGRERGGG